MISDIASRLFIERGFDNVTVDQVAEAADVSRMTVFNHFPRKEDLFFDLDEQGREDLLNVLHRRDPGTSPIEALRLFAHAAIARQLPYVRFFDAGSDKFMATIQASEALKRRARAIRDELSDTLSAALARSVRRSSPDAASNLAATLLVATWAVAFTESHRNYHRFASLKKANAAFLEIVDRGTKGIVSALEGTPYV